MKMENIQQPTLNIEHLIGLSAWVHWMLGVGCWMFVVPQKHIE